MSRGTKKWVKIVIWFIVAMMVLTVVATLIPAG